MTDEYKGPERRQPTDFEREVIRFMGRIDEHMENQSKRCDSHATDIRVLDQRMTTTEQAIQYQPPPSSTIGDRVDDLEKDKAKSEGRISLAIGIVGLASFIVAGIEIWRFLHP